MPRFKYFNTETNQWEYASSNGTNGKDGISPTISIEETDSGVMIEATNANGTNQIGYVLHGEDGFSPTVTIAENIDATITPDGVTNEEHTSTTVTITDKNGEKNFTVSNGKSAYKYAVEGGYTGTEEEFAERLAVEPLIGTTAEITPSEVKALMDAGKPFAITYTDSDYGEMLFNSFVYSQNVGDVILSTTTFFVAGTVLCAQVVGDCSNDTWVFGVSQMATVYDIPTKTSQLTNDSGFVTSVPTALKNPYALTINGTAYDGSEAVSLSVGKKENSVFYIVGNSTAAGVWTGTHEDITGYFDGLTVAYKTNLAGVSGGSTLNINGLGAIPVKRNASTAVTTTYPAGSVLLLTYSEGSWLTADYDANSKNTAGTSAKAGTKLFLVGASTQTSSGTTTYTNTNCYIGTDNRLYSGGAVVPNVAEITALIEEQLGVIENGAY